MHTNCRLRSSKADTVTVPLQFASSARRDKHRLNELIPELDAKLRLGGGGDEFDE